MQSGPPPMSPPLMQPVKKQRAGNTPDIDTRAEKAMSARRAELQKLQQQTMRSSLPSNRPAGGPPGSSAGGPPIMPSYQRQPGAVLRGGGRPTSTGSISPALRPAGGPPPVGTAPPPTSFRAGAAAVPSVPPAVTSAPPPPVFGATRGTAPPPPASKPSMGKLEKRHSDIFPGVMKSPKSPKPVVAYPETEGAIQSSPKPAAHHATTAAALKSPTTKSPTQTDNDLARRLEASFATSQSPGSSSNRSKSAPPSRPPPPPPGPPPLNKEAPAAAAAVPPPKKTVAFQPHPKVSPISPRTVKKPPANSSTAGATPFFLPTTKPQEDINPETMTPPEDASKMHAGRTPFHPTTTTITAPEEEASSDIKPTTSNAGRTPFRSSSMGDMEPTPPATSARRDLLRTMRAAASTPPEKTAAAAAASPTIESPELRMTKELARAEKEKAGALRQVTQLENNEASKIRGNELLQTVLHMADNQGEKAALDWARKNVNNATATTTPSPTVKQVGFLSPIANMMSSPMVSPRRRTATPHPKRNRDKPGAQPLTTEEKRAFLIEAAECSPYEYGSENATFIIRRPFGLATEQDLWMKAGQLRAKKYATDADVACVSTLEVIAKLDADDSIFVLHGEAEVRHQRNNGENFTEFGSVEERTTPLGSVSYIDKDATEKDYSLDDLYEAAAAVRQYYCSTVLATAAGLQMRKESAKVSEPAAPAAAAASAVAAPPPAGHPPSKAVETSDKAVDKDTTQQQQPKKKSAPPPPPPEEESSDVLGVFIQLFFSTIFGTIWFVFVTIPFRIITSTFVMGVAAILLSIIWLYLADDNGAAEMGASMRMYSNRPGIL